MNIYLSENESKHLGLRVGRARMDKAIDGVLLKREIIKQKFDLVKIKTNALQEDIFEELELAEFPYFVNSILYRNQIDYSKSASKTLPADYSYEPYEHSRKKVFKKMLVEIFDKTTGINYSHPLYRALVKRGAEKKMALDYYLQFNSSLNKDKVVWLLKKRNTYIGFVCGHFMPYGFEGVWYGILPKYRSQGLSSLLIDIIQIECRRRKVRYFYNDVQYQNIFSQLNVMRMGATPRETYLNIFLMPGICLAENSKNKIVNTRKLSLPHLIETTMLENSKRKKCSIEFWANSSSIPTYYTIAKLGPDDKFLICNFYNQTNLLAQCRISR